MHTYVVLIRGINVGPANRVAMADLRTAVLAIDYHNVRTVQNSGNLVLATEDKDALDVRVDIECVLAERIGLPARALGYSATLDALS